ncbi:MAG: GGDEF domain-containing protein [Erysipelotrichaceae bacterium]|nr:GGDEF domain-containing protein [Erysipelotrichaceae bacterium]
MTEKLTVSVIKKRRKTMAKTNEAAERYKTINRTSNAANIAYLILHLLYLVLFIIAKLDIMIYVTSAVIAVYLLFFLLIKYKKYYLYALMVGNEFFAFIILSSLMLGFSTGFHLFLIAFCVVSFFTTYFSKKKEVRGSYVWVFLSLLIYISLFILSELINPYYAIEKWLEMTLFIIHLIIAFAIISSFLAIFIKYASSLENRIMVDSRTDELTQIANRYGLSDYFEQEKNKNGKVLAMFDIDDFKGINDTYGHIAGDYVLKRIAEIVKATIEDAFICRYGGEEFIIVLDDNKTNSFYERLEAFRKSVSKETIEFEDMKINLTVTIGAVKYVDGMSLQKWTDLADEKLYEGKNSGKNKTVI